MPPLLLLRSYKVAKVTAVGGLITRFCSYGNPCMECVARETGRNRHRRLFIFTAEAFGYVNRYSFVAVKQQQKYGRSEEHTSELQSRGHLVCRLLLEKKKEQTTSRCGRRPRPPQASVLSGRTAGRGCQQLWP